MIVAAAAKAPLAIPNNQEVLLAMLQRRHPGYYSSRGYSHWRFCEETYNGGRQWFAENIFKYIKEGEQEFDQRCARAYRFNHTREVVDLIQKYIFKSDISRNDGDASDEVKAFWQNATLAGLSIDALMRLLGTRSSVLGRPWIFTDTTKTEGMLTIADQKKGKARVYAYIVSPLDVLDYRWDDDGGIDWVLLREYYRDDVNPFTAIGTMKERYRLWTKEGWALFTIQQRDTQSSVQPNLFENTLEILNQLGGNPTPSLYRTSASATAPEPELEVRIEGTGHNPIGVVPGRPADHIISDEKYCAASLIDDIAYLDRATANYLSNLDAIIQDQTFSQLAMPGQAVTEGDDPYNKLHEMGTKRIFTYDGESGAKPEYISPDVKQADLIIEVINKIINEIYSTVGAAGERTKQDNSVGIDNSSGVAKAYDFDRLNSLLTTKSESLCEIENWLVMMVELWNARSAPAKDLVAYPDTFDVRSLYDEFTVGERLMLMAAPDDVRREQMKQVIEKLFPALKESLKTAMLANLENWPMQDVTAQIQGTLTGDPSAKFPGNAKIMIPSGSPLPASKPATPGPSASGPAAGKRQGQVTKQTP